MKLLVTGGAGYVGSVFVGAATRAGHEVVVYDDLSTGHRDAVDVEIEVGDVRDTGLLRRVARRGFDAVVHFAALSDVPRCERDPCEAYSVNVEGTASVLLAARACGIRRLVVSSTCAVHRASDRPLGPGSPVGPCSVYGWTKAAMEAEVQAAEHAGGPRAVRLRYFNAAGASDDVARGERHKPETHIIPLAIEAAVQGRPFAVFGSDYDTPDGTAVRDYVHVEDLADAHLRALAYLERDDSRGRAFTLGTGTGSSVLDVLGAVASATGRELVAQHRPRRAGDAARLVADPSAARAVLGWTPTRTLTDCVRSAVEWHARHG